MAHVTEMAIAYQLYDNIHVLFPSLLTLCN